MNIDERAVRLQQEINTLIDQRCTRGNMLAWETIADDAAREVLGDAWEWRVAVGIGTIPRIAITRYLG